MKFEYFVYYSLEQQMEYSSKHEKKKKKNKEMKHWYILNTTSIGLKVRDRNLMIKDIKNIKTLPKFHLHESFLGNLIFDKKTSYDKT